MQAAGRCRPPRQQHAELRRRLKKKKIDPKAIWVTSKAKRNKFFEKYEEKFLDQPQPLRTDLEFVTDDKGFVDVTISPRR